MKFFVPLASGVLQAERIYQRIVDRLARIEYPVRRERVYSLIYRQGETKRSETVGATSQNGELVLAIFQHGTGYYVCTYSTGAVWGHPAIALHLLVESVEYFEEN